MKLYFIAGEASGDLHGANLMRALKQQHADVEFRCWGGDLMEAQGANVVKHYRELAFMGFVEVLMNIRTIMRNFKLCKQDILEYKPDAVVLIDYPGFNLRMAKFLKAQGIKVFYYISPQIWAWKQSRVHTIKKVVDRMFVILPFEKDFYQKFDYEVDFVGHPLLDAIAAMEPAEVIESEKPIIALLPGSRKQEVETMLPLMMSVVDDFPEHQFVVAGAPSQTPEFYQNILAGSKVRIVHGNTYGLLQQAHAALVTSGTATLETALFNVPEVVCYKGGTISYLIARKLVKVDYISLVNLVMDREVVKELIQNELNTANIRQELSVLVEAGEKRQQMLADYKELRERLGGTGASENTARLLLKTLQNGA